MSAAREALERIMDELRMEDTSRFDDDISKLGALVRRCELEDEIMRGAGSIYMFKTGTGWWAVENDMEEMYRGPTLLAALEQAAKEEGR